MKTFCCSINYFCGEIILTTKSKLYLKNVIINIVLMDHRLNLADGEMKIKIAFVEDARLEQESPLYSKVLQVDLR